MREIVLQNVGDDVWEVGWCYNFLFISEFDDSLRYFLYLILGELESEAFEVLLYVGFAGSLTQCVFTFTPESLR